MDLGSIEVHSSYHLVRILYKLVSEYFERMTEVRILFRWYILFMVFSLKVNATSFNTVASKTPF